MAVIHEKTKLLKINEWAIVKLSKNASSKLSSRGLALVKGTINGHTFQTALEPDGKGSHWFAIDKMMKKSVGIDVGDTVTLELEQTTDWPEPEVPKDLQDELKKSKKGYETWVDITPMARWEWTRWIRGTKNPETRIRRIKVALSKLNAGNRRPCCFNANECTVQYVSNKGILLDPN